MSSSVTDPKTTATSTASDKAVKSPTSKGKGKATAETEDMDDEDEDDEEEDGDDIEEEEEEEVEEDYEEIDPSAIVGRRTRGVKVDYTSKEALAKAGLEGNEDEDEDEDVQMKD